MFIIVFSNYTVFENKNIDNFNIAFTYFPLDFRFVVFIETKLYMSARQLQSKNNEDWRKSTWELHIL